MVASFTFDGKRIPIEPGDTYASALHRAGVRVLSRSLKYHRPRGLYCNMGSCASCFVDIDGVPNVPACMTRAEGGCNVRSQNRIGSAKHDLLGVVDKVYPDGFDPHAAFTRPKILNDLFLVGVRFMSGLGRAPKRPAPTGAAAPRRRRLKVDELIVGAGVQGLRRAWEATRDGSRDVLLVDEMPRLGGNAAWDLLEASTRQMAAECATWKGLQAWSGALCFGLYPRSDGAGLTAAIRRPGAAGDDLWEVTAARITIAAGAHDGVPTFPNNDLPGVMALRGALRLVGEHRVGPGQQVVVHGGALDKPVRAVLESHGATVVATGAVAAARGGAQVDGARIGDTWHDCDTILCNLPPSPRVELYQQAGCALGWVRGRLVPLVAADGATSVAGVHGQLPEAP